MAIEIVDFPMNGMVIFNSYVTNYQRVPWFTMIYLILDSMVLWVGRLDDFVVWIYYNWPINPFKVQAISQGIGYPLGCPS